MTLKEAIEVLTELADSYLTNASDITEDYRALVLDAIATAEEE